MRRIEHGQVQPRRAGAQQPGGAAEEITVVKHGFRGVERGQHCRIARDQRGRLDAFRRQRKRQRAGDIGEAAGFYQRKDFRRYGENADA
jgi:hypothetical protein